MTATTVLPPVPAPTAREGRPGPSRPPGRWVRHPDRPGAAEPDLRDGPPRPDASLDPSSARSAVASSARDPVIDLLRAGSVLVVVAWHWGANLVVWGDTGPYATNPVGEVPGAWLATWFLQVMPVFFLVGGWAHLGARRRAGGARTFVVRRVRTLAAPAALPLAAVAALWLVLRLATGGAGWVTPAALLLVTPLWFLAVYLVLVALVPAMVWAHDRIGLAALVPWAGVAVLLDLGRFRFGWTGWIGLGSFVAVYGFAHQLGFSWPRLVALGRGAWALVGVGAGGLVVLTTVGGYPRSMVGVVGEPVSNMAPPTVPVLFLALMQCGLVVLVRPHLLAAIETRPGVRRLAGWVNEHAMGVYLWHVGGYALAFALLTALGMPRAERFDAGVWAARPLWIATAAAMTAGLLWLTGSLRRARLGR